METRTRIPRISKKKQARLDAEGTRVFSTITPKPLPHSAPKQKAGAGAMMQRRSKIPKTNPERQKKAAKRGAAKHKAYMASETRKVVDVRAEGRCEFEYEAFYILSGREMVRCTQTEGLEHHHKTYSRYGGNELPTDILKVCKPHHDYLESLKPAGNRRSRRIA